MKYLLLLIPFIVFAQEPPVEVEKYYYKASGWFGPWPQANVGDVTPNGEIECEATIFEDGKPIPRQWVKLQGQKVKCPVEVDNVRKQNALNNIADIASKKAIADAAKNRIKNMNCNNESGINKDICEYIQGL